MYAQITDAQFVWNIQLALQYFIDIVVNRMTVTVDCVFSFSLILEYMIYIVQKPRNIDRRHLLCNIKTPFEQRGRMLFIFVCFQSWYKQNIVIISQFIVTFYINYLNNHMLSSFFNIFQRERLSLCVVSILLKNELTSVSACLCIKYTLYYNYCC